MDEPFEIPVFYKGQEFAFPARLFRLGYIHRFAVDVNGQEVFFEPDEEQKYRAMIDPEQMDGGNKKLETELLKAIADAIEGIVN